MKRVSHIPFILKSLPVLLTLFFVALYAYTGCFVLFHVTAASVATVWGLDLGLILQDEDQNKDRFYRGVAISAYYFLMELMIVLAMISASCKERVSHEDGRQAVDVHIYSAW